MNFPAPASGLQPRPMPGLVSLVFPVYQEEEGLPHLRAALEAWLATVPFACEVVLVDDGSRDGSWAFLERWAAEDPRVRGLSFSRNFGHQSAITAGMAVARGDAVVILDADLQDPLEVVTEMVAHYRDGYDVVYGQRAERAGESTFKRLTAWAFYRLMRRFVHAALPVDAGDFRLVSRRCLDTVLRMNEVHRFVRGMFAWVGYPQTAVRYARAARLHGETKYPFWKMAKLAWNAALSFSIVPVKLIGLVGTLTALFALGYGGYAVVAKYFLHETVPGWTGLVVIVAVVGGANLLGLAILGEYVGRIFEEVKGRPLYVVREATWGDGTFTHRG
ncbi:MAG: glycosyltransferase family 2 protein [Anaeromyxobacteraceae bacterium]